LLLSNAARGSAGFPQPDRIIRLVVHCQKPRSGENRNGSEAQHRRRCAREGDPAGDFRPRHHAARRYRAYSEANACRFAAALDPSGIELFEQPCRAEDWDANAKVASVSPVPVMLDEPICELADVKRAASIPNVGFCKLKLKRFGGLDLLRQALDAVRQCGMEPVLGDGLSSELGCWMEACVASLTIRNAGEFNGFLKPKVRLFAEPLRFAAGELVLPEGFRPVIDANALAAHTVASERFAPTKAAWAERTN
jgi:hypothetical protein